MTNEIGGISRTDPSHVAMLPLMAAQQPPVMSSSQAELAQTRLEIITDAARALGLMGCLILLGKPNHLQ